MHWHVSVSPKRQSYVYFVPLNMIQDWNIGIILKFSPLGSLWVNIKEFGKLFMYRNLNWKKVSFSKPPPTPFRQSPPMQQGSWKPSFQRGKDKQTNVVLKRLPERRQRRTERRQSTVLSLDQMWQDFSSLLCSSKTPNRFVQERITIFWFAAYNTGIDRW